ncbi:MAG: alpha/beta hydrolase [Planctomycetes bacterium]|nr:alpha/beta hydrolase [Planctomycetota bacterium]
MSNLLLAPLIIAAAAAGAERLLRLRDSKRLSAPGEYFDIGGHRLHYRVFGAHHLENDEDTPLVVLEADSADWSTHFGDFPQQVAKSYAVLVYDRAGLGWSSEGPGPRDVDTLSKELHRLLVHVGKGRRALLVGHGFGTWIARMYAHRYPFETAGIVLLDGEHEGFAVAARRKGLPTNEPSSLLLRLLSMANFFGILRALRMPVAVPQIPGYEFSERAQSVLSVRSFVPAILRTIQAEQDSRTASLKQIEALKDERFEFPVRIVAAGQIADPSTAPKGYPAVEVNRLWVEQQRKLLSLSSDAKFALADGCHHYLALGAPDWVLEAIRDAQESVLVPERA